MENRVKKKVQFKLMNKFQTISRFPYLEDPSAYWCVALDDGDMALLPEHYVRASTIEKTSEPPPSKARSGNRQPRLMESDPELRIALGTAGGLIRAEALKRSQCHDLLRDFAATIPDNWNGGHATAVPGGTNHAQDVGGRGGHRQNDNTFDYKTALRDIYFKRWPSVLHKGTRYTFDGIEDNQALYDKIVRVTCLDAILKKVMQPTQDEEAIDKVGMIYSTRWMAVGDAIRAQPDDRNGNHGPPRTLLSPRHGETKVPTGLPPQLKKLTRRVFIVDSGATTGSINDGRAQKTIWNLIRKTKSNMTFDTANDAAKVSQGVRAQVAWWDCEADYVLMPFAPELISMGERCMFAGFHYIWIAGKHPCFLSRGA